MVTISRVLSKYGYCSADRENVPIGIEYISHPMPGETKKNLTFFKNSNQCRYLSEGKYNLGRECEIYINSDNEIQLDISDMRV